MKEIVDRILNGKFEYERDALDFSSTRIEITMHPDEEYMGSFFVSCAPGKLTEGYVCCYENRMTVLTDTFSGTKAEIGYSFSAVGLETGDVVKGELYVVSNHGEYYIPFVVSVVSETLTSSIGPIRNLFHFANLARTNWDEAVKLFYFEEFKELFVGNDKQYYKAYIGLSRYYGQEQNVEEFLIKINKKHAVEFIAEKNEIVVNDPMNDCEEFINITRNGWGYTSLNVQCDENFVEFTKESVTDTDFLGNYLKFPIIIRYDKLHAGNNFARIRFFNSFVSFDVKLSIIRDSASRHIVGRAIEQCDLKYNLITYYLAFRTHKISTDTWLSESKKVINAMLSADDSDVEAMLYNVQLLISSDRANEAKWLMDRVETLLNDRDEYYSDNRAYLLYLSTLYDREESYINEVTKKVWDIFNRNEPSWRVAWMLLYLSEEFAVSPSKKWVFIESLSECNCISPVIYLEAINMLKLNPAWLTRLGVFEQRILRYAAFHNLMSDELINQFLFVVSSKKTFSPTIFEILKKCYEGNPSDEIVSIICEVLINADCKGPEYYDWYLKGITRSCHAINLYEYFMNSLDISENQELPKMVFLYFSYNTTLNWQQNAYLYSKVLSLKGVEPEIYSAYEPIIKKFALNQIMQGHINLHLAKIYKAVLSPDDIGESIANSLTPLLFTHRIMVEDRNISKVIVYQCKKSVEEVYPVINNEAFVPLYSDDYTILLEDNFSNRFMESRSYDIQKLLVPGKMAFLVLPYVMDNLNFDVYACELNSDMVVIDDENRERYRNVFDSPDIDAEFKEEIRAKLIQYYYDNDRIRDLDLLLESLEPGMLRRKERNNYLKYLVSRGMYDTALSWLRTYGMEDADIRVLLSLSSHIIGRSDPEPSQILDSVCTYLFMKNKYDDNILKYLVNNYKGMTREKRHIFNAVDNFSMDISDMCENILIQMLYTGYYVPERMEIYRKYVKLGAKTKLCLAFLTECSFEYLVKEQLMESYVFEELTKFALQNEKLHLVCELAYVKYYSEHKHERNEVTDKLIAGYLTHFIENGIYMNFFHEFVEMDVPGIQKYFDKVFVEYKSTPGKVVYIHYIVSADGEETPGEYTTSRMKEMFGGFYAETFVIFFGENLMYYITEADNGNEELTESGNISKGDIDTLNVATRFCEINDIVMSKTMGDFSGAHKLLNDYYRKLYITKNLVKLQ